MLYCHAVFTEAQINNCLVLLQEKLKPLMDQLNRVKDLTVPEFGTLQAWEVRANAAARSANGDSNSNDPSKSSQAYNGTPMPFLGETKVKSMLYNALYYTIVQRESKYSFSLLIFYLFKHSDGSV